MRRRQLPITKISVCFVKETLNKVEFKCREQISLENRLLTVTSSVKLDG